MNRSLSRQFNIYKLVSSDLKSQFSAITMWLISIATIALISFPSWAACTINTQGVNFGNYDPFSTLSQDINGNISLNCSLLVVSLPYTIFLSTGGGTYDQRTMVSGTHVLNYNLYTFLTHTSIWGNGTGGTDIVFGIALTGLFTGTHTIYGRIPAKQNAYVGNYSDNIIVTLTY